MRVERTAKTVIAGLMSVACLASVAACGPGSSSNKANTETEAVTFPIESPAIDSIEVNKHGKVRRAKLYYLRKLTGKKGPADR